MQHGLASTCFRRMHLCLCVLCATQQDVQDDRHVCAAPMVHHVSIKHLPIKAMIQQVAIHSVTVRSASAQALIIPSTPDAIQYMQLGSTAVLYA